MRAGVSGDDKRASAPAIGLPQLDAEMWPIGDGDDAVWFERCLTASVFPDAR